MYTLDFKNILDEYSDVEWMNAMNTFKKLEK